MRKETSNQFTEGLISDLNPINTPNNVLTDALNATIITYNGNEYNLQNDRGNYELEHCRLKPNYIPVGIKEYGDILYIVSYNPLDKNVEIGSYPSPLMVSKPMEPDLMDNDCSSIIKTQILDKGLTEGNYTNLMENADSVVFNGDDYKLNPGDEYCLQVEGESFPYKYETVEFHILDEDSNIHNINDKIKIGQNGGDKDFQHVAWTIPGWLAIKARLAELSTAGINIKSFYVPKTEGEAKSAYFSFDLRLNIKDEFLTENIITDANGNNTTIMQEWCKAINNGSLPDVKFRVFIEKKQGSEFKSVYEQPYIEFSITDNSNTPDNFYLSNYDWSEWFGSSRMLWKSIYGRIDELNASDIIRVSMVPILCENEHNYKIVYDNLRQELLFDLGNIEDDKWNIGSNLYQFYTSADGKSQYIYTDISGPKISSFPVDLQCDIYNIDGEIVISNYKFSDYSGIGENLLRIPFDEYFKKEDIYIIKFKFYNETVNNDLFPTVTRFLITSEVFNDFSNKTTYDKEISFGEWINHYWNKCDIKTDIEITPSDKPSEIFDKDPLLTNSDLRYQEGKRYNTFFPEYDSGLSDKWIYRKGYTEEYDVQNNSSIKHLTGPLWDSFGDVINEFNYKDSSFEESEFAELKDSVKISRYIESIYKYNKDNSFKFAEFEEKNFNDNLLDYIGDDLNDEKKQEIGFDIGKITDYRIEIYIHVIGGGKDTSAEDDNSAKEVRCSARLLKNGKAIKNDWYNKGLVEISDLLNSMIFDKSAYGGNFTWTDDFGNIIWRNGGVGAIEPCLLPKLMISWVLRELKLPFIWVSLSYKLSRSSSNWKISTGVIGGESIPEVCIKWDDDNYAIHDYVAFPRRIGEYGYEGRNFTEEQIYDKDKVVYQDIDFNNLVNWNPVLIPLTTTQMGTEYFKNMCDGIYFIDKDAHLEDTSVYLFSKLSEKNIDAVISIYHRVNFSNKLNNLTDVNYKLEQLENLKSLGLNVVNTEIFAGEYIEPKYNLIYTETLKSAQFNDTDGWPYRNLNDHIGFDELNKSFVKWASNSKTDVSTWLNSSIYKSLLEGSASTKGIYIKYDVSKNHFTNALTDAYSKTGKLSLYGRSFDGGLGGDTEDVLKDLSDNNWNYVWGILTLSTLISSLNIATLPEIMGGFLYVKDEQDGENNILTRLITGDCATLDTWTNTSKVTDSEARFHFIHGTVWKDYPTWILDADWDWMRYPVK